MYLPSSLLLLASLGVSFASAAPAELERRQPEASSLHQLLTRQATSSSGTCNLAAAQMPQAPTPLPSPAAGLALTHVAIGRGTQNYTCANSTAQAIPVQVGAMASLFNATCLAAPYPQLLSTIPGIAVKLPVPSSGDTTSPANVFLSGVHYFLNATTPFFDLDTSLHQWGTAACKKTGSSAAPDPTTDVPWLMLTSKDSQGCTIEEVYRVNTVGGQPPATCAGQNATIYVQYAAEYWFWAGPGAASR